MKHAGAAFLVAMLFAALGLWGIAQQKNGTYSSRLRDLEARYTKIEDEHRTFVQQTDKQLRRVGALEADLGSALVELRRAVGERDELRAQLAQRTEERDRVAADLKAFSTDLQTLVGRVETAIANGPRAGATTEAIPASRRSE